MQYLPLLVTILSNYVKNLSFCSYRILEWDLPLPIDALIAPPLTSAIAAGLHFVSLCDKVAWKSIIASVMRLPEIVGRSVCCHLWKTVCKLISS